MAEEFWDTSEDLLTLDKNDRGEQIIIKRVSKKGKEFIDVRSYYLNKLDELCPGKGIAIPGHLSEEIANTILNSVKERE